MRMILVTFSSVSMTNLINIPIFLYFKNDIFLYYLIQQLGKLIDRKARLVRNNQPFSRSVKQRVRLLRLPKGSCNVSWDISFLVRAIFPLVAQTSVQCRCYTSALRVVVGHH